MWERQPAASLCAASLRDSLGNETCLDLRVPTRTSPTLHSVMNEAPPIACGAVCLCDMYPNLEVVFDGKQRRLQYIRIRPLLVIAGVAQPSAKHAFRSRHLFGQDLQCCQKSERKCRRACSLVEREWLQSEKRPSWRQKAKMLGSTTSASYSRWTHRLDKIAGLACLVRDETAVRHCCGLQSTSLANPVASTENGSTTRISESQV